jgi:alanine dehydrogenase
MIIAVPKEIKQQEHRVALLPSAAYQLIRRGHEVLVERGAGAGAGYPDSDYAEARAELLSDHETLFERSELVVKVKEPLPSEYRCCASGADIVHLSAPGGK